MVEVVSLSLDEVRSLAYNSLIKNGCNNANAEAVTETIVIAERDGSESHGLFRLPGYVASLRSGKVNGAADPKITHLRPGVIRVDNDNGYAPLGIVVGQAPLIDAARSQGIATVASAFDDEKFIRQEVDRLNKWLTKYEKPGASHK